MNRVLSLTAVILFMSLLSCSDEEESASSWYCMFDKNDTTIQLNDTRGVRSILEDSSGNLWLSTPAYVAKFDGDSITYYSEVDGYAIGGDLHLDKHSVVWVDNGVMAFNFDGNAFQALHIDSSLQGDGLFFQRSWFLTDTGDISPGFFEVTPNGALFHPYPVEPSPSNKHLFYPTSRVLMGADSTLWGATMEKVFGSRGDSIIVIGREEMGRSDDDRNIGIRGIHIDSQGDLWIADNGAGLFKYDGYSVVNLTKKLNLDEDQGLERSLHRAFSVGEDSLGYMWIGTVYSGIWVYNPQTEFLMNFDEEWGVESDVIWTVYQASDGSLLFGGEAPAIVYRFKDGSFTRLFHAGH